MAHEVKTGAEQPSRRVLVAEDSPTQAQHLQFLLEAEGMEVEAAPDGQRALDRFYSTDFDLVITDVVMPGLTGYELCRKIKDDPAKRHVPVILLTTLNDPMDIIQGLECGADNFITKPFDPGYLISRIRYILESKVHRAESKLKLGAEIVFLGKKLLITADKEQILDLLLATFEEMVRANQELKASKSELELAKAKVEEYAEQLVGKVRTSEDKYRRLMEQANDAIFLLDANGKVLELNHEAAKLVGGLNGEMIGRSSVDFMPPELFDEGKRLTDGSMRLEGVRVKRLDGSRIWVDFSASVVEVTEGPIVLVIARDVTERTRAAQRLAAQHASTEILAQSASLDQAAPLIIQAVCESVEWEIGDLWIFDRQTNVFRLVTVWHSPSVGDEEFEASYWQATMAPGNGLAGRVWTSREPVWIADFAEDASIPQASACVRAGLRAGCGFPISLGKEVHGIIQFFSRQIQPRDLPLLAMMNTISSQIGQFVERKHASEALIASEERFRLLVEGVKDYAITMLDRKGHVATWNVGAERIHGYRAEEILGRNFSSFFVAEDTARGMPERHLQQALAQGRTEWDGWQLRKNGTQFSASVAIAPLFNNDQQHIGFVKVSRDVSKLKQMEDRLRQAQKMEAFGQLAGGVAHDFNNLLTIISGYSEILLSGLTADDPLRPSITEILRAGERAASLTRQLLAFSRRQLLEAKVLDLNAIVKDIEKMLRRLIGEDIQLTSSLEEALGPTKADPSQIEQILLNLAVNARDAMPEGGDLTIETANVHLDDEYANTHPDVKPGLYSMIAVSDTGCGMDAATQARIFEPFFTTKAPGKGTGLGLATVFGIVKQSEGHISVYSEPGNGTVFKVYLPSIVGAAITARSHPGRHKMPAGTETILVVEDEESLRTLATQVLQNCGYKVLQAANGEDAIQVFEHHRETIRLLVSDVVMPTMSGRKLAERLIASKPDLKVLFVSGYTDDAIIRHGVLEAEAAFLQKPFTPSSLAGKVRAVLDQDKPGLQ